MEPPGKKRFPKDIHVGTSSQFWSIHGVSRSKCPTYKVVPPNCKLVFFNPIFPLTMDFICHKPYLIYTYINNLYNYIYIVLYSYNQTLPCQNLPSPSQPTCPWRCLRCLLLHLPWRWQLAPVGRACRRCQAAQKRVAGAKNAEKTCEFCPLVLQFGLPWPPKILVEFGHFCSPEVNMTTNNASIVKKRDRFNSTRKTSWRVNGIRDCKNVVNIILNSEQLRQTPSLCLARNPLGANRKNTEKRDSNDSKIPFSCHALPPPTASRTQSLLLWTARRLRFENEGSSAAHN